MNFLEKLINENSLVKFLSENKIEINDTVKEFIKNKYEKSSESEHFDTILKSSSDLYQINVTNDCGKDIIACEYLITPKYNKKKAQELVKDLFEHDLSIDIVHIFVPVQSSLYSALISIGGVDDGQYLLSKISDGIKYLKQYTYDKNIKVVEMKKSDIDEVVEVSYLAEKNSDTSRAKELSKSDVRDFIEFLFKNNLEVLVAKEKNKIVGFITTWINNLNVANVMSIGVHPEHQRRGISKLLYYTGMLKWQEKGSVVMAGTSSSQEVLKFSKNLKRKAYSSTIEFKRKNT